MIKLKEFQEKMVDKLLRFTAPDYKVNELLIKAPTGSGKTICLLSWIMIILLVLMMMLCLYGLHLEQEN
uniref:CRISPR-associated helicase Cas3 n=1 Tax=Staphylococcus aureus TaxID=1280 RepID=D2J840_STAAU|nr:CRISPR-associated helicase Cas3 [Staphylococcus aureus]